MRDGSRRAHDVAWRQAADIGLLAQDFAEVLMRTLDIHDSAGFTRYAIAMGITGAVSS